MKIEFDSCYLSLKLSSLGLQKLTLKYPTYGNGDVVIGEDESGIDTGQFAVARHFIKFHLGSVQVAEKTQTLAPIGEQARKV